MEREPAGIAAAPDVREWTVPWEGTRPRDPYVDGKGRVWFVGQQGDYVAYLEPKSGKLSATRSRLELIRTTWSWRRTAWSGSRETVTGGW